MNSIKLTNNKFNNQEEADNHQALDDNEDDDYDTFLEDEKTRKPKGKKIKKMRSFYDR